MPSDFSVLVAYPFGTPKAHSVELIRFRPLQKGHKTRSALLHSFSIPPNPLFSLCKVFISSNMTPRTSKWGHFQSYSNIAHFSLTVFLPPRGDRRYFSIFVDTSILFDPFEYEPDRPIPFHVWSANNAYMLERTGNPDQCGLYGGRAVGTPSGDELVVYDFIVPRGRAPGRAVGSSKPANDLAARVMIGGPSSVTPPPAAQAGNGWGSFLSRINPVSRAGNDWESFPSRTKPFWKSTRKTEFDLQNVYPEIDDERIITFKVRIDTSA